jgi:predicted alpha/beta hydrolase family esterase
MKKRVYISHDWNDREEERWLFWLKKKLEALDFEVFLSNTQKIPAPSQWLSSFEQSLNIKETHIVTHDPGCLTILSYLTKLKEHNIKGKVLLIAGQIRKNQRSEKLLHSPNQYHLISNASQNTNKENKDAKPVLSEQKSNEQSMLIASLPQPKLVVVYDASGDEKLALPEILNRAYMLNARAR